MTDKQKNILIACLIVALAIVSWIAFKPTPEPYDKELIEAELKRLDKENDSLAKSNKEEKGKQIGFIQTIDSFSNLKPKIKYIYVQKEKEIDNATVNSVVNEFGNVFSDNNIK